MMSIVKRNEARDLCGFLVGERFRIQYPFLERKVTAFVTQWRLGNGLLATVLRHPYELRDGDYFNDIPSPKLSKDMPNLASPARGTKASRLNAGKFKGKHESALKAFMKRNAAGTTIEPKADEEESNVTDVMDALKPSLGCRKPAKPTNGTRGLDGRFQRKAS